MGVPTSGDFNKWDGTKFDNIDSDQNVDKIVEILANGNYDLNVNKITASDYVGIPSDQFTTITAGENLSAGDVIRISSNQAFKADNTTEAGITAVVGVCNTTVTSGETVQIDYGFYNSFSSLTAGTLYYVGTSGSITSTRPVEYQVKLGVAVSTTRINLDITIENDIAGQVAAFARTSVPTGWLECNGQNVSRTTYANLFNSIGVTWGVGNGSSTFTLPDMRDRYPRGKSTSHEVGAYLNQLTKRPTTSFTGTTSSNGAHTHEIAYGYYADNNPNNDRVAYGGNISLGTKTTISAGSHTHTTTITGGGDSETRPKTAVVLYCIKF